MNRVTLVLVLLGWVTAALAVQPATAPAGGGGERGPRGRRDRIEPGAADRRGEQQGPRWWGGTRGRSDRGEEHRPRDLGPDFGGERRPGPEEIEQFMEFTKQHFPDLHERLVRARQENGPAFRELLHRAGPPMFHLLHRWRDDPELAAKVIAVQKVEMKMHELRKKLRPDLPEAEQAAIKGQLRQLVEERFKLRNERLKAEIANLRKRLDQETARLAEQEQNKDKIINEEYAHTLTPPGPPSPGHGEAPLPGEPSPPRGSPPPPPAGPAPPAP